jgi:hypothetical protein
MLRHSKGFPPTPLVPPVFQSADVKVSVRRLMGSHPSPLKQGTYDPERNATELRVAAMLRSKVVGVFFAGLSFPVAVASCLHQVLLQYVNAVSHWTIDALRELAVRITGLDGSDFKVGDGGCRGSGGAEGESDNGTGVHADNLKLVRIADWSSGRWCAGE